MNAPAQTTWPGTCRGAPVAGTSIGAASAGTDRHLPLVGTSGTPSASAHPQLDPAGPVTVIDTARGREAVSRNPGSPGRPRSARVSGPHGHREAVGQGSAGDSGVAEGVAARLWPDAQPVWLVSGRNLGQ